MKRHLVLPVVAAATAGLLLTSCSGGDSEPDDDIAGAQTSAPPEEPDDEGSEDDAEEPDDGIDRPEIELPDDLENVFEPAEDATPEESAVLADQERYVNATYQAITAGPTETPALEFYAEGEAYFSASDYATSYIDDGYTVSGGVRYYDRVVTLREEGVATTSYCVDYRNLTMVDTETGEQFPSDDRQGYGGSRLERDDSGVWKTVSETVFITEDEC